MSGEDEVKQNRCLKIIRAHVCNTLHGKKITIHPVNNWRNKCKECQDTNVYMGPGHAQNGQLCIWNNALFPASRTCFWKVQSEDVRLHMQILTKTDDHYCYLVVMTKTTKCVRYLWQPIINTTDINPKGEGCPRSGSF